MNFNHRHIFFVLNLYFVYCHSSGDCYPSWGDSGNGHKISNTHFERITTQSNHLRSHNFPISISFKTSKITPKSGCYCPSWGTWQMVMTLNILLLTWVNICIKVPKLHLTRSNRFWDPKLPLFSSRAVGHGWAGWGWGRGAPTIPNGPHVGVIKWWKEEIFISIGTHFIPWYVLHLIFTPGPFRVINLHYMI